MISIQSKIAMVLLAFGLASCQASGAKYEPQPDAPVVKLGASSKKLFENYLNEPLPSYFFVSRDGRSARYFHCKFGNCTHESEDVMRTRCVGSGTPDCITYARGRTIVVRTE